MTHPIFIGINLVTALPSLRTVEILIFFLCLLIENFYLNLVHALPSLHALKLSCTSHFFAVEYVSNAIIFYLLNVGVRQNRHNTSVYCAEHEF